MGQNKRPELFSRDLMMATCFVIAALLMISLAGCNTPRLKPAFGAGTMDHSSGELSQRALQEVKTLSSGVPVEQASSPFESGTLREDERPSRNETIRKEQFETRQTSHTTESKPTDRILKTNVRHESEQETSDIDSENDLTRVAPGEFRVDSAPFQDSIVEEMEQETVAIDLATVLEMVGANNWDVQLAEEKVRQARAQWKKANVAWLPALRFAVGYTGHDGEIQSTPGPVIEASRSSLFVGGGAGTSAAPLTGGAGGPARMFVDLSVADAIFEPKAKKFLHAAARANSDAVFNDTFLAAATAYYELVRAHAGLAVAKRNQEEATVFAELIDSFVKAGKGSPADVNRAKIILQKRQQEFAIAQGQVGVAQAKLIQLLQTEAAVADFNFSLAPSDATPMAVSLVDEELDLAGLVAKGLSNRPEIRDLQSRVCTEKAYCESERWRPILPHVHVGGSAGGFGGGSGSNLPKLDGRADIDVIVAWEVENMGIGTNARRKIQSSRLRQSELELASMKNQVTAEVSEAYHQAAALLTTVSLAEKSLTEAEQSFEKDIARIKALEGMPLELVQTIGALATVRKEFLATVIQYNIAQLRLLRAVGGNH